MKHVSLLLAHAKSEHLNVTVSSRDLRTPLHIACSMGNLPIVQLLLWVSSERTPLIPWRIHSRVDHNSVVSCLFLPSTKLFKSRNFFNKISFLWKQPGLLCTSQNFARSSKFLGKKYMLLLRLPLRHFLAFPKFWRSHVFRDSHKPNFELVHETLIFQGHLNIWGSFMASLCSGRWSDQICCKTECVVALKTKLSNKTNVSSLNPFSCKIQICKVRVEVSFFFWFFF